MRLEPGETFAAAADFRRDGVVRVRGLLAEGELAELRRAIDRYTEQILPQLPPCDFVLEADGRTPRNFWRMEQHDPVFEQLGHSPRLVQLVAPLVGGEPVFVAAETFNKPARVGSSVPYHQDNAYFCQAPPDMLTVWIALDPVTVENGPVYYVRGSHTQGTLPHRPSGVAGNSMGLADPPDVPLEVQYCGLLDAGDATVHHCQTIHHSQPNRSGSSRLGMLLVYRGSHTRDDPQLRAAYESARNVPA